MKIDLKITTGVAAALMATACSQPEDNGWTADRNTAICTDRQGVRVSDDNCQRANARGGSGMANAFLWYYIARNASIPYYGDRVSGGSYSRSGGQPYFRAPAGSSMTRAAAVSRGGFGSSARSFGGGSGE